MSFIVRINNLIFFRFSEYAEHNQICIISVFSYEEL